MTLLIGTGPQIIAQKLHSESSTALHDVGAIVHTNKGQILKYCKAGATALVMGSLYQASAEDTTNYQALTITNAAAGDTSITTTTTVTLAANELAGGILTVESATTGAGQMLGVKSHAAFTAAAATFQLEDPVVVATTGTALIDLIPNPFWKVVIQPTSRTSAPVGVAVYNVTAAYFGWLGVSGPFPVLAKGALTVGLHVTSSDATAGAVEVIADAANELLPPIGVALTGVADTDFGMVNLNLL